MTTTEAERRVEKRAGLTAAGGWVAIGGSVIHLVLTALFVAGDRENPDKLRREATEHATERDR